MHIVRRVGEAVTVGVLLFVTSCSGSSDDASTTTAVPGDSASPGAPGGEGSGSTSDRTPSTVPGRSPSSAPGSPATTGSVDGDGTTDGTVPTSSSEPPTAVPITTRGGTDDDAAGDDTAGHTVAIFAGAATNEPWLPVGYWSNGEWSSAEGVDGSPGDQPALALEAASVDLDEPLSGIDVDEFGASCVDGLDGPVVDLGRDLDPSLPDFGFSAVAATADWALNPGQVRSADVAEDEYSAIAASLIRPRPWLDPSQGEIVQGVRADLDADGTDEIVVAYEHVADPSRGQPGDFSLIFAHAEGASETGSRDDVLFSYATDGNTVDQSPGRASVAAIADLNGDGTMEVVVRSSVDGITGVDVYEWSAGGPTPVLTARCSS